MAKQFTFGEPTTVTHVYPDGSQERVTYGYFESVVIVKENGYDASRTIILIVPTYPVTDMELENGTKILFDEPLYKIELKGRGD